MSAAVSGKVKSVKRTNLSQLEHGRLAPTVMVTGGLIRRSANIIYGFELGLRPIEWRIIARVGDRGATTQAQLADMGLHDKGQLSRAVAMLVKRRLLNREQRRGRSIELSLSPTGLKIHAAITRISLLRQGSLLEGINKAELRQFLKVLDRVALNATRLLQSVEQQYGSR